MTRLTVVAVGSRGDVQPHIALGREATAAGFDVRIATHPVFEPLVASYGLAFAPIPGDPKAALGALRTNAMSPVARVRSMLGVFEPYMRNVAPAAKEACDDADIVVFSSLGLAAYEVARAKGIPAAYTALQPTTPTRRFPTTARSSSRSLGPVGNLITHVGADVTFDMSFRRVMGKWRRQELGLPRRVRTVYHEMRANDVLTLCAFSEHVVPRPPDWPDSVHLTGYWPLEAPAHWEPPADVVAFLQAGPAPVYAGFGSVPVGDPAKAAAELVEGARQAGCRLVIQRGWAELAPPKGDDVLVVDDLPHDWLFPQMRAAIHHAGAGTTASALLAGIPSVPVTIYADNFFWARRLKELGAAGSPVKARRLSAARIAASLTEALDDRVVKTAAELGSRLRDENGPKTAVGLLRAALG